MTVRLSPSSADEIHIYSDGAWLSVGKRKLNIASGGWGAVVIGPGGGFSRLTIPMSGRVSGTVQTSTDTEIYAALQPVLEVARKWKLSVDPDDIGQPKPHIVLHCDDEGVVFKLNELRKLHDPYLDLFAQKHGKAFIDLLDAVIAMDITVQHTGAAKSGRKVTQHSKWMNSAHDMARREAWMNRLKQQGCIFFANRERLEGRAAIEIIDRITPSSSRSR